MMIHSIFLYTSILSVVITHNTVDAFTSFNVIPMTRSMTSFSVSLPIPYRALNQLVHHKLSTKTSSEGSESEMDEREPNCDSTFLPCLPPSSSFQDHESSKHVNLIDKGEFRTVSNVGADRFELQYTCKICETRNSHRVSRMAYRNGIVITVCKGCLSKHLIADNLGWTKYLGGFNGDTNIEEFMKSMGRGDEVSRVSKEVFDLENILYVDNTGENNHANTNFLE